MKRRLWLIVLAIASLAACNDPPPAPRPSVDHPAPISLPTLSAVNNPIWMMPQEWWTGVAKIQTKFKEKDAEIARLDQKAKTADKAVDIIRWASLMAFAAMIPAWLIGGWRTAIKAGLVGLALAFAPTIIGELWTALKPYIVLACAAGAVWVVAHYVAAWIHHKPKEITQ